MLPCIAVGSPPYSCLLEHVRLAKYIMTAKRLERQVRHDANSVGGRISRSGRKICVPVSPTFAAPMRSGCLDAWLYARLGAPDRAGARHIDKHVPQTLRLPTPETPRCTYFSSNPMALSSRSGEVHSHEAPTIWCLASTRSRATTPHSRGPDFEEEMSGHQQNLPI